MRKTYQYQVTLSNGKTFRVIAADVKKAYNRAEKWAKKQGETVTVKTIHEIN